MSTEAVAKTDVNYLNCEKGFASWFFTTDHKRIGVMYLFSIMIFFFFAVAMAVMMRLELMYSGQDFLTNDQYNRILSLHGIAMVFVFVIPGIPAVFGNFFLPIMIGADDVAFPKINLLSWYCLLAGALLALISVALGGPNAGWTFYVPLSLQSGTNIYVPVLAAFFLGWSSILTGLNFIVTIHRMRIKNMGWFDMPLFCWSLYATGWVQIIATPVVGILLVLLMLEKFFHIGFFDPTIGGDPILFEHIFWIYSHPAVYVMILPAMGVVSEIIPTFARKTIFGYKFIAFSSVAIASLGSLVWAHHMFTSGMAYEARVIFSYLTFLVAIPSAIKVFNWVATLYKGSISLEPPMTLCLSFVFLFLIGGLTGLFQGALASNIHLHDTSFIVAHFHYVMFGSVGVIFFAAMHYWYPKMFGKMYNFKIAQASIALFFIGFNLTYFPLFLAGFAGMPRRYADYLPEFGNYHFYSTLGSWVLAVSLLIMFGNFILAAFTGEKAPINPWGSMTLEWETATPPVKLNFDSPPEITHGPYDYPTEVQS